MEQIDLTCILGMRKCVMGHFMENETDYQNLKLFHDTIYCKQIITIKFALLYFQQFSALSWKVCRKMYQWMFSKIINILLRKISKYGISTKIKKKWAIRMIYIYF